MGRFCVSIAACMIAACAALAAAGRVLPQPRHASIGILVPVDDCRTDPELAAFRRALLKAIAQPTVAPLRELVGPMIQIDFEARVPRDVFLRDMGKRPSDAQAEFRRDVRDALELGITKAGNPAYAPAIYLALGDSDHDMVITGKGVKVYAEPKTTSRVVAMLSFDLVNQGPDDSLPKDSIVIGGFEYAWRQVVTPSGENAWVPGKYVRGRDDIRLYFEKIDGRWKLTSIIGGD